MTVINVLFLKKCSLDSNLLRHPGVIVAFRLRVSQENLICGWSIVVYQKNDLFFMLSLAYTCNVL